jgi:hypothetical protein
MRPQQQNRRMRGRNNSGGGGGNNNNNNNNNNRKGPNPLTRSYESNGPDVKIRGSAQQIAEKYTTLARDAHTSGDRVMSENYLQHAEHYNRIIAAAQAQMPIQQMQNNSDDDGDEEDRFGSFDGGMNGNGNGESHAPANQQQPAPAASGSGPQPVIEGMPAEVALNPEASGQAPPRHRERRPHVNPAPANPAPEAQAAPGEPVAATAADDEQAAPRRSRRPRRGDRSRGDFAADQGGETAAAADGDVPPVTETSDGAAALAAFDN